MRHVVRLALALFVPAAMAGCKKAENAEQKAPATTAAATAAAKPVETPKPAEAPKPMEAPKPASNLPEQMAANHILFAYKGATRAKPEVTRSKEDAEKAAKAALDKLKGGTKFEELASAESDCPSKTRGGNLGAFPSRMMHPKFSEAAAKLADGALSDVVETPFGYHIIRRNKLELMRASHILYMYKGGRGAQPSVTRSKEEAQKAAEAALAKIKGGGKLEDIASKESDCPSKARGGDLGSFGKGQMVPAFEEMVVSLKGGELASKIVETPFGYHVIKRTN